MEFIEFKQVCFLLPSYALLIFFDHRPYSTFTSLMSYLLKAYFQSHYSFRTYLIFLSINFWINLFCPSLIFLRKDFSHFNIFSPFWTTRRRKSEKIILKVFFLILCHLEVYYRTFYTIWFHFMITTKMWEKESGINSLKNHFSFSWLLKNVFLFIAKSCLVYEKALQIIAFPKWTEVGWEI